jgi:hypothetical protein
LTEEQIAAMLAQMQTVAGEMKAHVDASCAAMGAKFDAAVGELQKKKSDATDPDGTMAEQVAADSVAVANSALASLAREVTGLKKQISRPMADLNAYADAQAKADAVLRTHCESAEPPMSGEDLVSYNIRLARKMQPHSKTWKGVDLRLIAADSQAFNIALDGIRADALQAGLKPVGLKEFEHRKIVKQMPGGHIMTEFVGTGTIFKMLSRPVRHVAYIGTRSGSSQPN